MFASISCRTDRDGFRPRIAKHDGAPEALHVISFGTGDPVIGFTLHELEQLHLAIGEHLRGVSVAPALVKDPAA
jgi:hypothetical protein